jgi:hypothetical protein
VVRQTFRLGKSGFGKGSAKYEVGIMLIPAPDPQLPLGMIATWTKQSYQLIRREPRTRREGRGILILVWQTPVRHAARCLRSRRRNEILATRPNAARDMHARGRGFNGNDEARRAAPAHALRSSIERLILYREVIRADHFHLP